MVVKETISDKTVQLGFKYKKSRLTDVEIGIKSFRMRYLATKITANDCMPCFVVFSRKIRSKKVSNFLQTKNEGITIKPCNRYQPLVLTLLWRP